MADGLAGTSAIIIISTESNWIRTHSHLVCKRTLNHDKSSSFSQLVKVNQEISKHYQNILKKNHILFLMYYYCYLVFCLSFLFYTQKVYLFLCCYFAHPTISKISLGASIIHFISIVILQTSWCQRVIVTILYQMGITISL